MKEFQTSNCQGLLKEIRSTSTVATDMSRHTVNIDRDQARLYDLI
jgi:hypothetical protein